MLSFSGVDSSTLHLGDTMTPIETNAMLALAFFTMLYYAKSVIISSDDFDPWRRRDRIRRHRARRRRPRRNASCKCCPFRRCVSCMPAPLPQRQRQARRHNAAVSPSKSRDTSCGVVVKQPASSTATMQSSSLRDQARMQDWSNLIQRCSSRLGRREARMRDADGLMPLHWACSGGVTADAVKALIAAYPKAARKRDAEGSSPLHFACHYGVRSTEVLQVLIGAYPAAVQRRDVYGRSPIWHAVEKKASIEVLTLLLEQDSSMASLPLVPAISQRRRSNCNEMTYCAMRYSKASTELAAASNERAPTKKATIPSTPLGLAWKHATYMNAHRRKSGGKKWNKAALLLEAAYHDSVVKKGLLESSKSQGQPLLHAALALSSYIPSDVVPLILQRSPEQSSEQDAFGRLPLAVAVSSPCLTKKYILATLIDANPKAASTPGVNGRLPLAQAIEIGFDWNEGIDLLVKAYPEALFARDTATGLFPFMLSASGPIIVRRECNVAPPKRMDDSKDKTTSNNVDTACAPQSEKQDSYDADATKVNTIFQLLTRFPESVRPL